MFQLACVSCKKVNLNSTLNLKTHMGDPHKCPVSLYTLNVYSFTLFVLPKEEFKLEVIEFKASRTSAAVLYVYVATFCSSGCKLLQIHNQI